MKKFGVAERLEIMVFPFQQPFQPEEFAHHMTHHTHQLFAAKCGIKEKIFVAVTALDPETRRPPMSLSVVSPLWHCATAEQIEEDVRDYLSRCRGLIVGAAYEDGDRVIVDIEMKRRRWCMYAAKIVRADDGSHQLCRFLRTNPVARTGIPLLPADPVELS